MNSIHARRPEKVVILAGGIGTRLQEETAVRPKPMVEIGGYPILWHIMKTYAAYGFADFVLALGYRGTMIKSYFRDYYVLNNNFTVDLADGSTRVHDERREDWRVTLVDTGMNTQTGGRVRRLREWIGSSPFLLTYGDGVSNVDIGTLVQFHQEHGKLATVTAVRPPARFGGLDFEGDLVRTFVEKPQIGEGWINGGYFVLEPEVLDYIAGDEVAFEHGPLEQLAAEGQLVAFRHEGFWQSMDTLRDVRLLEELCETGTPPWKVWSDQ
ncbi:MAG: glucose-1-phosphate cytidylyltransferase [Chloroflexi bacterium]|nr:glucose-1-phosphate cytidylyltransferase [Chloroflexota bacterium]